MSNHETAIKLPHIYHDWGWFIDFIAPIEMVMTWVKLIINGFTAL